ncbi:MAG: peptidyl-prolyl cis-trans isomerase [Spirochaetota bacterium]|nr:peptidyl-prolyl cis-trans isomerase [Spirochaetota bacterium]
MAKVYAQGCVVFAIFVFAACSSGDALASYTDRGGKLHEITRKEAYRLMGQNKDSLLADTGKQKEFIEGQLLQRIKAKEALLEGLDKEESYIKRTNELASGQLLLGQYFEQHYNRSSFRYNLPIYNISMIFLQRDFYNQITEPDPKRFEKMEEARASMTNAAELQAELERLQNSTTSRRIRKTDTEMGDYEVEFLVEAQDIAKELNKPGVDFGRIARERSKHFSATNDGVFGYVLPKQRDLPVPVNKEIKSLSVGGISEPINTESGYYIIKMNNIARVRNSTLKRYFRDPAKVQDALWFAAVWDRIDETIQKESGKAIMINYEGLASDDTNTVLLSIDVPGFKREITLGTLLHDLDYTSPPRRAQQYGIMRSTLRISDYTPEELGLFFEWMVSTPVLYYAAHTSGIAESRGFRRALDEAGASIIAQNMDDKIRETIKWPDAQEVQEYYNNNREKYTRDVQAGVNPDGSPFLVKQPISYEDVKDNIQEELNNKRSTDTFQEWKDNLIIRYQAKIHADRFEKIKPPPAKK